MMMRNDGGEDGENDDDVDRDDGQRFSCRCLNIIMIDECNYSNNYFDVNQ